MPWIYIPTPPARFRLLVDGEVVRTAAWPWNLSCQTSALAGTAFFPLPQIAPHIWEGTYRAKTYRIEPVHCLVCDTPLAIPLDTHIILHDACMGMASWDPGQERWHLTDGEHDDHVSVTVVSTPTGWYLLTDLYKYMADQINREHPQRWALDL